MLNETLRWPPRWQNRFVRSRQTLAGFFVKSDTIPPVGFVQRPAIPPRAGLVVSRGVGESRRNSGLTLGVSEASGVPRVHPAIKQFRADAAREFQFSWRTSASRRSAGRGSITISVSGS